MDCPSMAKTPPTNYTPHILRLARQGTDLRPANILVHYEIALAGGQRVPCQPQTLEQLYQTDFTTLDYRCRNLSSDAGVIRRWLCDVIQRQVDRLSPDAGVYFPDMGWNTLNGAHVYLAGNRLIGSDGFLPQDAYSVNAALDSLHFSIDEEMSDKYLLRQLCDLIALDGSVSACLTLYSLFSFLRPLFQEAGWERQFVCYLVGPSQNRKTTLAQWLTAIFDRDTPSFSPAGISLLSTEPAVFHELAPYADCPRLVDDLYASGSRAETRRREETVSRIIRLVGNNAVQGRGRSGAADAIRCGVICTAEYLPKGLSTLVRCLILWLDHPLPTDKLTRIQRQPLAWPTFLYRFLQWTAGHYEVITDLLREKLARFQALRKNRPTTEERLREFEWSLLSTTDILNYFLAAEFPGFWKKSRQGIMRHLTQAIEQAVMQQAAFLSRERSRCDTNRFSVCLAVLYFRSFSGIHITEKPGKKFRSGQAAVEHKGCLCMRAEYLQELMQTHFQDASITIKQITAELRRNHLLDVDKSQRSSKKLANVCSMFIRVDELRNYLGQDDPETQAEEARRIDAMARAMGLPVPQNV